MKKLLSLILALLMLVPLFVSCTESEDDGKVRLLSFAEANSIAEMRALNGKKVSIIGYMSTLSPVDGRFMYLMNLPYQSCPFCKPNTTQLSNTMAVYAKKGDEFAFTDRAIRVTGTMEFGNYTDSFGYVYNYRIKDATYSVLDTSEMSGELRLWQQLAATDVISDAYAMFEYVNFLCLWTTYTANFQGGKDYLYPDDALHFVEGEGMQYSYGFADGYFDRIVATIEEVDKTAFADLTALVREAEALADRAYAELKAGNYDVAPEYSGEFGDGRSQYKMDSQTELEGEMERIYEAFALWLGSWEL